jgi:hypothetical protein
MLTQKDNTLGQEMLVYNKGVISKQCGNDELFKKQCGNDELFKKQCWGNRPHDLEDKGL